MKQLEINKKIEQIRESAGVPYLDVVCYQSHKELYRYTSGEGATGKELLYMYSCGKPVTVVAALRLVEEGKMALDDLVCKYLPEVENAFILDEQGGQVRVGDKMTVRHLFTMTAGFTYNLWTQPILGLVESSQGNAVLRDFIAKFVETPLSFAPGYQFQYSLCHDVLAAVVEVVSGKRFSAYVNEVVFQPLNMAQSRFDNQGKNVFNAYMVMPNGKIERTDEGKILLVNSPWRGWEYPGGLIEPGETFEEALHREVREEAGVEIEITGFVGICKNVGKDIVNIDFTAKYAGGELATSEESTEVGWFTPEEAFGMITFPLTAKRLKNMLSGDKNAHLFCFRRDPFTVVEDNEFSLGGNGQ